MALRNEPVLRATFVTCSAPELARIRSSHAPMERDCQIFGSPLAHFTNKATNTQAATRASGKEASTNRRERGGGCAAQ